jgi:hypothetical protein
MISKELLSEVLKEPIQQVEINYGDIIYSYSCEAGRINIYELVHKCMLHFYDDYIFEFGPYNLILTRIYSGGKSPKDVYESSWHDMPYKIDEVFKACQWILSQQYGK